MKLFEEDFRYNREALELEQSAEESLSRIARSYLAKGASVRDVAHIFSGAVTQFECDTILGVPAGKTLQEHMTEN